MKKLTAEKARELIDAWKLNQSSSGLSINAEYCLQAMEMALEKLEGKIYGCCGNALCGTSINTDDGGFGSRHIILKTGDLPNQHEANPEDVK